jgi:hypothetical protein
VLVYHLYESKEATRTAKIIAVKHNLNIIEIHACFDLYGNQDRHKQDLDSLEILSYIYYADMIITTSFHGTALSLILEKQFYKT